MFLSSLLLLSAAITPATPSTPLPWFDFEDYPMKAFEKQWEGITTFELLVAPDGSVANCTVTESSGHSELDKATCHLAMKRAKFTPASVDGRPVHGIYRSEAAWALPERSVGTKAGPDLEISLSRLPAGTAQPPVVKLAYAVDSSGKSLSCDALPQSRKQPALLVELGCKELVGRMAVPVVTPSGQAVEAVRTGAVSFKADD